ncbi:hypothetical protein [Methylocapsa aurea]|uniref:hypothetical protein n=1 Tax=Methylocapsa aurea TaxID=663610 RepID=UPI00055DB222|nr:hypothetical protein [Methylocapsa aurea]
MWIFIASLLAVPAVFAFHFFKNRVQLRTLEAAAAAIPADQLHAAFVAALSRTLQHLCELPVANEKSAAVHLEMALTCAGRTASLQGKEGGAAFRIAARPLFVGMLRQLARYHGDQIRAGQVPAEQIVERGLALL